MNPIEAAAVAMTLLGLVLTIRQRISCWPVAIARGEGQAPVVVLDWHRRAIWLAATAAVSLFVGAGLSRWTDAAAPYADAAAGLYAVLFALAVARLVEWQRSQASEAMKKSRG